MLLLVIVLVIISKTLSSANYLSVSSSRYPHVASSPSASHGRNGVNMQEKECFVARLCEYKILPENFSCKVSEYVISNGIVRTLPKWLWLDEKDQTVKGIPSPSDEGLSEILIIGLSRHPDNSVGRICGLLTVKIVVWSLKYFPLFAQNIPTSPVIDNKFSKPSTWNNIPCQFNEPIVLASLVLAGNFHKMDGEQKINLLDELLQCYHISIYDVFVLSSNVDEPFSGLLRTSHVLASGPGANRSSAGPRTAITWHVRCGIIPLDDVLFQVMEELAQQLTLVNNVSYAPIGWHIVTGFRKYNVRRKRNIVGTTTPAFSTIPISRATVKTTKIKITRTTYSSQTKTISWSRPLPSFSSPYTANKTSLLNLSSTVTSRFNITITPSQYNDISSTLPAMSLSSTMFSLSQTASPSKQETSVISYEKSFSSTFSVMFVSGNVSSVLPSSQTSEMSLQYESDSSTLPVTSQSRNKSTSSQMSSKEQTSEISHSTKISSQIDSTLTRTRSDNLVTTSQLPSSKIGKFVDSSSTTNVDQRSSYMIVPSRKSITSSLFATVLQTVINNISLSSTIVHSLNAISSRFINSLSISEQQLVSTSRFSSPLSTTATTIAIEQNTTTLLQPSFSNFITSSSLSSSRAYSPVLHNITSSRIVNEIKSTTISHIISYERSTTYTRSSPSNTASSSTNVIVTTQDPSYSSSTPSIISIESSVQRSNPTATSFLPCSKNSCGNLISTKNTTPTSSVHTTPLSITNITSERTISTSHITGTLVLKATSRSPQSGDTLAHTNTMLTPGIVSTSLQSSDSNISEIIKTSITNSITHSSRLGTRFTTTHRVSSSGDKSSPVSSGSRKESKFTSRTMPMVKLSSTGKTPQITTSQSRTYYQFSTSLVSTTIFSTTMKLTSTYSHLIKSSSTTSFSVQTKAIQSGSHITNIVRRPSASSLFTPPNSGVNSTLSSIPISRIATTLSSYHARAFSDHLSEISSSYKTTTSIPSIATTSQSSLSDQLSQPTRSSFTAVANQPSSYFLLPYSTATSTSTAVTAASLSVYISYRTPTSPSLDFTTTPSLLSLSSNETATSSSTAVIITSSSIYLLQSLHSPTSLSSVISTIPSLFVLSSYHARTSPLALSTSPSSSDYPSSYHSSTSSSSVITITPLANFVSSYTTATSQQFVVTSLSDQISSSQITKSSNVATITSSPVFLTFYTTVTSASTVVASTYQTPASKSLAVITTASSRILSSYKAGNSLTTIIVASTPSSIVLLPYYTPTSYVVFSTSSTSTYHAPTLLSSIVNITSSSDALSTYYIPTPLSSTETTSTTRPFSPQFQSPYLTSPSSLATIASLYVNPSYPSPIPPSTVGTINTSSEFLAYRTLRSSVGTITSSSHSLQYNASSPASFVSITHSPVFPSSYRTATLPSAVTIISSVFVPSYNTFTSVSPLPIITTPSDHAVTSPFSLTTESFMISLGNISSFKTSLSAPYKTFSLSFLSSSIASSQLFTSSDRSMMVPSTSTTYTFKKISSSTTWLPQPSYKSRQSSHTKTVLLTHTSVKMPVITSSSRLIRSTVSSQSSSSAVTLPTMPSKESPKIYNKFDLIRVTVSEVFNVQIPADTFHDREDGNTRNLKLECLTADHARLSKDSWLQFNSTTQTLYGLILKSQLGGVSTEYLLTASDRDGNTVYDAFTVNVEGSTKLLAAIFSVKLAGINLENFNRDLGNVLSIVRSIAGYYGDKDESLIQVVSLTEGSVIFSWSNTSIETCDDDLINDTASKLITSQGDIQPYFYNILSPRFVAEDVFVNYTGPCGVSSTENPSVSELSSHENTQWLKYVLPAVVVAVIIVVIAVAFLLVRRHSGEKILKEDKQIFRRRKPIILDGEQEMSTLSGKPIELPEDSLTPIRFPRETSFGTPEYYEEDTPELPSPILAAPSYQRLPPRCSDGFKRHNSPPPPYRLPPSY